MKNINIKKLLFAIILSIFILPLNIYAAGNANKDINKKAQAIINTADKKMFCGNSKDFTKKLNDYRKSKGMPAIKESKELNEIAMARCVEELNKYIKTGDADHNSPSNINDLYAENLRMGKYFDEKPYTNVDDYCIKRWSNSKEHNENLLNKEYKTIGYASVKMTVDGATYEISIYIANF